MEALIASYADDSSDSDSEPSASTSIAEETRLTPLPPPPISVLHPPNSLVSLDSLPTTRVNRVRSFPHVEGNYALHVYIPVHIPSATKKELASFLKKVTALVPTLHAVDVDVPLSSLLKDEALLEKMVLGREFHISLGRTVPLRVHQINSMVSMLRHKLQFQRRYLIDFNKWEIFVNDDSTRTFMSLEVVAGGLAQDPRPHISVAWALGDISDTLKRMVEEEMKKYTARSGSQQKCIFTSKFSGILCKIGNKMHEICKFQEE
ncbi:uncharacterized protein LOC132611118 isoform X3 [Lycium barbarum]|uniref:uncharacterized protein LOC132611118 isoform X3 n=1 Tax=Lycium barbarum TaxID=112863 RepID=UPI00293E3A1F|nr:uncharacterized protein LOC132611118 isoform X3 [Lycium barbarum]